ncbi:helix-turn-helix domain-containing protein [Rhizosphaericola mali]|uniref:XRE family transcriptional regulator n=1 Tax=Rhizosphaericola mali TaxID=2545455 RepID=A0A5P2G1Y6_9BACT|nr:XRE family transcriptional regulator [Rhizosphaericola mali]QES89814.1 XRE family transcriptional regulator [Rhizosphaericola mali]
MEEDVFLQIGNKVRELRKSKAVTLQTLADDAGISKGMVSQIENSRSVPSLPVLLNIIKALDADLNLFFKDINLMGKNAPVLLKKKAKYESFEKEKSKGFHYRRILTFNSRNIHYDFVLLRLESSAKRKMVTTDAFEFKYLLKGQVQYVIGNENYDMDEGDSLYFDARVPHNPINVGKSDAEMLIVYIFDEKK